MNTAYTIRRMQPEDLIFAAARTFAEGWQGETIFELAGSYQHDPDGCFIAEIDGDPVGMCFGVAYDTFGFLGGLIVLPEVRGQGIGRGLLEHTTAYLEGNGLKSVFLDGVPRAVSMYERCGFQKVCRSLRFQGQPVARAHPHVEPMQPEHLEEVYRLDRAAFGANRATFLQTRLRRYPSLCKVALVDGHVEGYIMGRIGHTVLACGPWIASPRLERPADLLEALAYEHPLLPFSMGCLEDNAQAAPLVRSLGLVEKASCSWRMVHGQFCQPGVVGMNFAVGSPAKG